MTMTAPVVYYPYIGAGKVYAKEEGVTGGLVHVGNVSKLTIGFDEETKEQQDFTQAGGGVYASVNRVKAIPVSFDMTDLNPTNFARAVFGEATAVAGATVTSEEHVAYKNSLVVLAHPNPTTVSVKNDGATVTYTAGTDYEVRTGGIYILDTFTGAEGSTIEVTYTYAGYNVIEALTASAVTLQMYFEGVNEANGGKVMNVELFRVKIGAAKQIDLIGDDFAALSIEGKLQADTTKTGAGKSKYYRALAG
jgi:hypothetical protein